MKKHVLIATFLALMPSLAAADEAALQQRIDALEKRVDQMDALLKVLGPLALVKGAPASAPQTQASEKTDLAAAEPPTLVAHLDGIKPAGKDILGKEGVDLQVSVTNNSSRDIDILTALVRVSDVAGNSLLNVTWKNNKGIQAAKTVTMHGQYSNSFGHGIETALATDPSLLRADIEVYKVAFKGGEVVTYKDCGLNCD